jgi:ribosomal protein S18 acetylase RimI-like enzyme
MSRTILLHDRATILAALAEHRALHLYAIGDLDDFFFPYTAWFALESAGRIRQIALLYTAGGLPVILALAPERVDELGALLASMLPVLPRRFYMHVTPGAAQVLEQDYALTSHGLHIKMALVDPSRLEGIDTSATVALGPMDQAEIEAFYVAAYPGNWFDPRMLETRRYVGARAFGMLVSVAGVHVYSPSQRVAALGNVATLPAFRGRGLGAVVTAALCRELLADCDTIGLNVHAGNRAAIRLYERLGFTTVGEYEEYEVAARA